MNEKRLIKILKEIINRILPITKGGTGATTPEDARTNLGLGDIAVLNSPIPLENGGTGSTTAETARTALGFSVDGGVLPISLGGTGAITAETARINLGVSGALRITQLWSNPKPSQPFAGQTIPKTGTDSVDLTNYTYVGIISKENINTSPPRFTDLRIYCKTNEAKIAYQGSGLYERSIDFITKTNQITFADAKDIGSNTINNNLLVPRWIYGITFA